MILQTQGLSRRFGGLKAVDDVSFAVAEHTVQSIIGPNGAGKTTFFNLVTGALSPDAGRILFRGRDVTGFGPDRLAEMGLVRTFQRTSIFRDFTVAENVSLAIRSRERRNQSLFLSRADEERIDTEACAIVAEVGLAGSERTIANNLSHGAQRALDVAIGLAGHPRLILMDEPLAGMSQGDRASIATLIVRLREEMGLTVVLVEHDIGMVMRLSDRITVFHHGRVIAAGPPAEIREDAAVRSAYLRGSFAA